MLDPVQVDLDRYEQGEAERERREERRLAELTRIIRNDPDAVENALACYDCADMTYKIIALMEWRRINKMPIWPVLDQISELCYEAVMHDMPEDI